MLNRSRRNREHRSKPPPYDQGGILTRDCWYPATLHPDECVMLPRPPWECVRPDHHHGDDTDE